MLRVKVKAPPAPGTYCRVLRRYDRHPGLALQVNCYTAVLPAIAVEMDGVVAPTVFVPNGKETIALFALRFGWKDETTKWLASLKAATDAEESKRAEVRARKRTAAVAG